jgi:hypothetical protein
VRPGRCASGLLVQTRIIWGWKSILVNCSRHRADSSSARRAGLGADESLRLFVKSGP